MQVPHDERSKPKMQDELTHHRSSITLCTNSTTLHFCVLCVCVCVCVCVCARARVHKNKLSYYRSSTTLSVQTKEYSSSPVAKLEVYTGEVVPLYAPITMTHHYDSGEVVPLYASTVAYPSTEIMGAQWSTALPVSTSR